MFIFFFGGGGEMLLIIILWQRCECQWMLPNSMQRKYRLEYCAFMKYLLAFLNASRGWSSLVNIQKFQLSLAAITCPKLTVGSNLVVSPPGCATSDPRYGQQCVFSCDSEFTVHPITSAQVTCLGNGEWSRGVSNLECIGKFDQIWMSVSHLEKKKKCHSNILTSVVTVLKSCWIVLMLYWH